MNFKLLAVTALFTGLLACTSDDDKVIDSGDTAGGGDTGSEFTGSVLVQSAEASCSGATTTIAARTQGWTFGAEVTIFETGSNDGWDERHTVDSVNYGELGWWDELEASLGHTTTTSGVTDGTSLFGCDFFDGNTLTFALQVTDEGGGSDCVIWGADPNEVTSGAYPRQTLLSGGSLSEFSSCVALQ